MGQSPTKMCRMCARAVLKWECAVLSLRGVVPDQILICKLQVSADMAVASDLWGEIGGVLR